MTTRTREDLTCPACDTPYATLPNDHEPDCPYATEPVVTS